MNARTRCLGIVAAMTVAVFWSRTVAAAPNNADFLNQAFQDLLARSPSGAELSSYQSFLTTHTRQEAALDIETATPEFHGLVVDGLYSLLLHRAPASAERSSLVGIITLGATIEQAESNVGGSTEYFANRGSSTNPGFLTAMFSDLLGRTPSPTDLNVFGQQLTLGTTRTDVTAEILASNEYRTDLVNSYFNRYLRRTATPSDASFYVSQLNSSVRDEVVISELIGSNEYFNAVPFPEPASLSLFTASALVLFLRRRGGHQRTASDHRG